MGLSNNAIIDAIYLWKNGETEDAHFNAWRNKQTYLDQALILLCMHEVKVDEVCELVEHLRDIMNETRATARDDHRIHLPRNPDERIGAHNAVTPHLGIVNFVAHMDQ